MENWLVVSTRQESFAESTYLNFRRKVRKEFYRGLTHLKHRPNFNIINNTGFEFVVPPFDINIDTDGKSHYQLTNWSMFEKPTNQERVHADWASCQKAQVKVQRSCTVWSAHGASVINLSVFIHCVITFDILSRFQSLWFWFS